MATISNIAGIGSPGLTGQVGQTTKSPPDVPDRRAAADSPEHLAARTAQTPSGGDAAPRTPPSGLDSQQVGDLVSELQEALDRASVEPHSVSFRLDDRTEDFVIEIHDPEGELVKQIPPEKILNLRLKLDELSGMVLDHKS